MTNNMALADMAAMQRIRDKIARSEASERAEDKAALVPKLQSESERAALAQNQNMEKPVPVEDKKVGLSQVVGN